MSRLDYVRGKRKYLFCCDQRGMSLVEPIVQQVKEEQLPFDWLCQPDFEAIPAWLSQQKMGCYLYIAGRCDMVVRVKKLAEEAGFSEEETQWATVGHSPRQIFCCRCHSLHFTEESTTTCCPHCGLVLDITEHYSRRWEAYLGGPHGI
ncbi:dimethylamine monooxygenase subunit DmmA family protein [Ammoniphilus sp. 3BR4]|uniref:dimethylamine monooxygenase subunit DmmA family protein n=1 Tax=Ammoniphilus sp. 3BR4 TaxID=3158265 RepID=UPI0034657743